MRFSEIDVAALAEYLGEDEGAPRLPSTLAAGKRYVLDYTGLTAEQVEEHEDLSIAVLAVCADLYDLRTTVITGTILSENPVTAQILGAHDVNLL